MKKFGMKFAGLLLALVIGVFMMFGTGCTKTKGTLYLDNYTTYSMYVTLSWVGGSYSVGSLGFTSHDVESGSGTATAYKSNGSYWASCQSSVPAGGSETLYIYSYKQGDGLMDDICISNEKPANLTK